MSSYNRKYKARFLLLVALLFGQSTFASFYSHANSSALHNPVSSSRELQVDASENLPEGNRTIKNMHQHKKSVSQDSKCKCCIFCDCESCTCQNIFPQTFTLTFLNNFTNFKRFSIEYQNYIVSYTSLTHSPLPYTP